MDLSIETQSNPKLLSPLTLAFLGDAVYELLVRRLVTDKAVKSGLSRQRDEIEKAIIKALADPANGFSARLCQSLSQTLGAQMERMAKDAEKSICA